MVELQEQLRHIEVVMEGMKQIVANVLVLMLVQLVAGLLVHSVSTSWWLRWRKVPAQRERHKPGQNVEM